MRFSSYADPQCLDIAACMAQCDAIGTGNCSGVSITYTGAEQSGGNNAVCYYKVGTPQPTAVSTVAYVIRTTMPVFSTTVSTITKASDTESMTDIECVFAGYHHDCKKGLA